MLNEREYYNPVAGFFKPTVDYTFFRLLNNADVNINDAATADIKWERTAGSTLYFGVRGTPNENIIDFKQSGLYHIGGYLSVARADGQAALRVELRALATDPTTGLNDAIVYRNLTPYTDATAAGVIVPFSFEYKAYAGASLKLSLANITNNAHVLTLRTAATSLQITGI